MGNSVGGGNSAGFDIVGVTENREMYVYKSMVEIKGISLAAQSHTVVNEGKAPVSACKPLCAIFL